MAAISRVAHYLLRQLTDTPLLHLGREVRGGLEALEEADSSADLQDWAKLFFPELEESETGTAMRQVRFIDTAIKQAILFEMSIYKRTQGLIEELDIPAREAESADRIEPTVILDGKEFDLVSPTRQQAAVVFSEAWSLLVETITNEIVEGLWNGPTPDRGEDPGEAPKP